MEGMSFWVILERVFSVMVVMLAERHEPKLENYVLSLFET